MQTILFQSVGWIQGVPSSITGGHDLLLEAGTSLWLERRWMLAAALKLLLLPGSDFVSAQARSALGEHSTLLRQSVLRIIPQQTPHLESKVFLSNTLFLQQDVFAGGL